MQKLLVGAIGLLMVAQVLAAPVFYVQEPRFVRYSAAHAGSGGTGGSMTYPGAGLAVSTGTAWSTSVSQSFYLSQSAFNRYSAAHILTVGPQGPQGPVGPTGATGATGPAGTFSRPEAFTNISTVAVAALPQSVFRSYTSIDRPTLSDILPAMDSSAAAGTATTAARGDHSHPSDSSKLGVDASSNVRIGATDVDGSATKTIALGNATGAIPTTSPTDTVQLYANDQSAGNAGLEIRAEGGQIHKLGAFVNLGSGASSSRLLLGNISGVNGTGISSESGFLKLFAGSNYAGMNSDTSTGAMTINNTSIYANCPIVFSYNNHRAIYGDRMLSSVNGHNLTIQSSGSRIGSTNYNGGNLILAGGISTGTGSSNIQFQTATSGTTGTTDRTPTTKATIDGAGTLTVGDATNGIQLSGTDLLLTGTATGWDDLRVEPVIKSTGTNDPVFTKYMDDGAGSRGVYAYAFTDASAGNEKEVFFSFQMPHTWKEGSTVVPHIHWFPAVAGSAGNVVRWGLECSTANMGSAFPTTTTTYCETQALGTITTQYSHMLTSCGNMTMTGFTMSSVGVCRMFRNSSHANDTLGQTAGLLYIDIHYEINRPAGSKTDTAN